MKDISHHMKKFVRKCLHPFVEDNIKEDLFRREQSLRQEKKQHKLHLRREEIPVHKTEEERNREQRRGDKVHKTPSMHKF